MDKGVIAVLWLVVLLAIGALGIVLLAHHGDMERSHNLILERLEVIEQYAKPSSHLSIETLKRASGVSAIQLRYLRALARAESTSAARRRMAVKDTLR